MMKSTLVAVLLTVFCLPAFGDCYVIDNLKGQSVREFRDFDFFEDKYTAEPIKVTLAGGSSKVNSLVGSCEEPRRNFLVCTSDSKSFIVETWHIVPLERKAVWTKSRHLNDNQMSGASILVGDIVGKCD